MTFYKDSDQSTATQNEYTLTWYIKIFLCLILLIYNTLSKVSFSKLP